MFKRDLARSQTGAWIFRGALPLTLLFLLIEFFDELAYGAEGTVLPALRDSLGLTYAQIGLLLGLPAVFGTAVEFIMMLLGDTRLRKWLVVGGGFTIMLASLLMAGAQAFLVALLALDYPTLVFIRRDHALIFTKSDNPGRGIL